MRCEQTVSERRSDVRWFSKLMAVALLTAGICVPAVVAQKTLPGKGSTAPACGDHGTSVHFEESVKEAARVAEKEQKLVLAIHISGHFEDSNYT
jgi:hypothetical protein